MHMEKETQPKQVVCLSWGDRIGMGAFGLALLAIFVVGIAYAVSREDDNSRQITELYKSTLDLRFAVMNIGRTVDPKFQIKSESNSAD